MSAYERAGGFDTDAGARLSFRPGAAARGLGFGEDALLGWRVRRSGRAAFAPDAIVEHQVFPPDIGEAVRRAWMTGAFPALVGEVPELRDTALARRFFLGTTRVPLYASALLALTGRRRLAVVCLAAWVLRHASMMTRGVSARRFLLGLPGTLVVDGTTAVALIVGSARSRRVVL